MKSVLDQPVRVDRRGEHLYFFDGAVCVDVQSGTPEQRKAVLDLLAQTQAMARVLQELNQDLTVTGSWSPEVERVLRDGGILP